MPGARLVISESEIKDGCLVIKKMSVIDPETGAELRIAKITPELKEFIHTIEIDVSRFFEIMKLKEKNPKFKELINTFKLYT